MENQANRQFGGIPDRFSAEGLWIVPIANAWGRIVAHREGLGRPIGAIDAFVAATAQVNRLTLATRNQSDFELSVDAIFNPWSDA